MFGFGRRKKTLRLEGVTMKKLLSINDQSSIDKLWEIYSKNFDKVNEQAPCQQSVRDKKEFEAEMAASSVIKYVLVLNEEIIALGMVANDLLNCTWISNSFFEKNFPNYYTDKKLYYFMGIVVDQAYRSNGLSLFLLESIIDDLPADSAMGFDHSFRVNKFIPFFTRMVRQHKKIITQKLDKQVYYLVSFKK